MGYYVTPVGVGLTTEMKSLSAADRLLSSRSLSDCCDAVLYLFRSGKGRELFYFAALEMYYWWCYIFRRSRLVEFTPGPRWHCCPKRPLDLSALSSALRPRNLAVTESPVKWSAFTQSANVTIFGST